MPRKYRPRRRRKFSRKFRKKRNTLGKKVAKLSKFVYKTIEKKYVTNYNGGGAVVSDGLWNMYELTTMGAASGTGDHQRVGNCVTLGNFSMSMAIQSFPPQFVMRVIVIQTDRQGIQVTPTGLAVDCLHFGTTSAALGIKEGHCLLSPYKTAPTRKFRVLMDKTYTTSTTVNDATQSYNSKVIRFSVSKHKRLLSFNANTAGTQAAKNNIYVLWRWADFRANWIVASNAALTWISRYSYRDA